MNECCSTDSGRLTIAEERRRQLLASAARRRPGTGRPAAVLWAALALLALALTLLSAGCRSHPAGAAPDPGPQTPFPPTAAAPGPPYLEQALAQIPADARRFAFTDWRRVRAYHSFQGDSQRTGRDQRAAYMLDVMKMSQAAAQMDSAHFLFQAQNWGWDSTDLLWEAQAHWLWLTESVFLLRFRDDFDFAPLRALLAQRAFTPAGHRGQTIHATPLDHNPDWHFRSHLAHHAMAILPAEKLLIMAPTPEPIHRVLAVRDGAAAALLDQPAVAGVLHPLLPQAAVEMQLGPNVCRRFGRGQPAAGLSPYTLLAAAYLFEGQQQRDLLLLHYENGRQAAADLDGRRAAFQDGVSPRREVAYGEEFALEEAAVDGPLLRFHLAPTAALRRATGRPQTLLGWVQDGDARFAAC